MYPREWWLVGPGRLGLSLGSLLVDRRGVDRLLVVGRRATPPSHALMTRPAVEYADDFPGPPPRDTAVLMTVPDDALAGAAAGLGDVGEPADGCVALHFSGALEASVLAPLAELGYAVGSLHPITSIADPEKGASELVGVTFAFQGRQEARAAADALVESADGRLIEIGASAKIRYHVACVFASNYLVTCLAVAARLMGDAVDVRREEALAALKPLWSETLQNVDALGLPTALTGPVARGDVETVRRHLRELDGATGRLYRHLARETLALASELGLDTDARARLELELQDASSRS